MSTISPTIKSGIGAIKAWDEAEELLKQIQDIKYRISTFSNIGLVLGTEELDLLKARVTAEELVTDLQKIKSTLLKRAITAFQLKDRENF